MYSNFKNSFKCDVGLSDHSLGFEASIVAIALGAKVIEKHFTLSKKLKGPDHAASLSPTELQFFVKTIRRAEKTLGDGIKKPTKSEIKNISGVRREIVAKVKINKNSLITSKMITYKRPFIGLAPKDTKKVLNHIALKNFQVDEPIKVKHLKKVINYKILSADHKDWDNVLKNFDEKISNDIYQSKEYLKLYENYNQKKSESFLFSLNNDYFFLSYIKNQINNKKFGTFLILKQSMVIAVQFLPQKINIF